MARPGVIKTVRRRLKRAVLDTANRLVHAALGSRCVVNRKEIRVLGLQRSGNHAVINWILRQAEAPRCVLNFVEPGSNPFLTFHWGSTAREIPQEFERHFNHRRERLGFLSHKATLIVTYEDDTMAEALGPRHESARRRWTGVSAETYRVLILRDPYNLLASRLRREADGLENKIPALTPEGRARFAAVWKDHARAFLGEGPACPGILVPVNFNAWAADKEARRLTAERLGLSFTDAGADEVLPVGGGSSFARSGKSAVDVGERWLAFASDPDFRAFFASDPELRDLSLRVFGPIPGTESL